jgi:hypothetical protein
VLLYLIWDNVEQSFEPRLNKCFCFYNTQDVHPADAVGSVFG